MLKLTNYNEIIKSYIGKTLDGKKFKSLMPDFLACKFIGNNFNNFKYKIGENNDIHKFIPQGINQKGGLYITDLTNLHNYYNRSYGNNIAFAKLYDDTTIYIEDETKCKVDKLMVYKIKNINYIINNLIPEEQIKFMMRNETILKYIKNISTEIKDYIMDDNYELLQYISKVPNDLASIAIFTNDEYIKYIKNPSTQIQILAIKENINNIKYIKNPSIKTQKIYIHKLNDLHM